MMNIAKNMDFLVETFKRGVNMGMEVLTECSAFQCMWHIRQDSKKEHLHQHEVTMMMRDF